MDTVETLRAECDALLAVHSGITAILSALITTHPNYEQLQLRITSYLELELGGPVGQSMDERHRDLTRQFVEQLQMLQPARTAIAPLGSQKL